jgi:MoaA/NifB/PqqE/SkfB family radical SAM enzyme
LTLDHDPVWSPLPHQPGVLLIHLLNRCNLFCQHCYLDAAPSCNTQLPLELVIRTLDEIDQLGIATIYLSGGEPLLYSELSDVLASVSQRGFNLIVASNGTLIGTAEAAMLKDSGASVQVSIDGPEAYHDLLRGSKGVFRRARFGIQQLVAAEVPVTIVMTICRDNISWLPWLAQWASQMGVARISVQPLLKVGRGADIHDKKLSKEQLCDLFLQLSDLGHKYLSHGIRFSLAYRTRRFLLAHPCAAYVCNGTRCHRKVAKEIKKLVIREDGTVLPEIPTLNYRFALGNLHKATLTELIAHYFNDGYAQFDHLCRTVYKEVMPIWTSPLVPWDEIVSERSWMFDRKVSMDDANHLI